MKWWWFMPLLCTLLRLNWAKQTPGIMRRNQWRNLPPSGFELATQWSEAQHATAGLRRPPHYWWSIDGRCRPSVSHPSLLARHHRHIKPRLTFGGISILAAGLSYISFNEWASHVFGILSDSYTRLHCSLLGRKFPDGWTHREHEAKGRRVRTAKCTDAGK